MIGNAASAVQFIPEIAKEVDHLTVFQRSANWMIARGDRPFYAWETWICSTCRARSASIARFSGASPSCCSTPSCGSNRRSRGSTPSGRCANLETNVADPELRARLTPDYPIGGKRILIPDDFFPALSRPNVELVTSPIARVTEDAVVDRRRRRARQLDVLIFAHRLPHQPVPGADEDRRRRAAGASRSTGRTARSAYFGLTMTGYPNLFMLYGPNTNLGHNSIIFMLECQIAYVMNAIQWLIRDDLKYIDLKPRGDGGLQRAAPARPRRHVLVDAVARRAGTRTAAASPTTGPTRPSSTGVGPAPWCTPTIAPSRAAPRWPATSPPARRPQRRGVDPPHHTPGTSRAARAAV